MERRVVAGPLWLVLVGQGACLGLSYRFPVQVVEQLLDEGSAGLAKGVAADRRQNGGCTIGEILNLYEARVVNLGSFPLESLPRVENDLVADLQLLVKLGDLHLLELQLQVSLLFLPLELQVLHEDDVLLHYVAQELNGQVPVSGLSPLLVECLSALGE